jgi:hypothetical protein
VLPEEDQVSNSSFSPENNKLVVLDQLAERVRVAHEAVQTSESNALDSALDAGAALLAVRCRVYSMKAWMAANLPRVGASTLKLYMQLERGRAVIEAARKENPFLSICEARRLVAKKAVTKKPRGNDHQDDDEEPAPLTDEQVLEALTARGVAWFIANMPEGWREALQARLRGPILRAEQKAHPNTRLKNLNLRLVSSTDQPTQH